jgi:hypothetical protein
MEVITFAQPLADNMQITPSGMAGKPLTLVMGNPRQTQNYLYLFVLSNNH